MAKESLMSAREKRAKDKTKWIKELK